MRDEAMDPRLEKLVALAYGELPADEAREVEGWIEQDPALRAEWDELCEARAALRAWEVEEMAPSFELGETGRAPSKIAQAGGRFRALAGARRVFASSAWWGFAAAAVLLIFLASSDFRIQRVDGGVVLRLGKATVPEPPVSETVATSSGGTNPLEDSRRPPAGDLVAVSDSGSAPAGGQAAFVTREEFDSYSDGMTRVMVAMLKEYGESRDRELVNAMETMYQGLTDRQFRDYQELRKRIEAVGSGLSSEKAGRDELQQLMDQSGESVPIEPHGASSNPPKENDR
jgi:anti-sigma factor RsiW